MRVVESTWAKQVTMIAIFAGRQLALTRHFIR